MCSAPLSDRSLHWLSLLCLYAQNLSEKKKRSTKAEVQVDTLKQLMDYLTHFKLTVAIDRNLHLLQTMKNPKPGSRVPKPEEFVRVYDILLQVSSLVVIHKHK